MRAMLRSHQLTEILNLNVSQIVPIPDVPLGVMGICNWRGEVLWIIDLGHLLGFDPLYVQQNLRQQTLKIIVVNRQGQTLGLAVSQVDQMVWCDPTEFQWVPDSPVTSTLTRCLEGYWLSPTGERLMVLDGNAVMDFETKE